MTGCAIPLNFHKEVSLAQQHEEKWNFTRAVTVMFHDCSGYRCIGVTPLPTTPINLMNRAVYRCEKIVFEIPRSRCLRKYSNALISSIYPVTCILYNYYFDILLIYIVLIRFNSFNYLVLSATQLYRWYIETFKMCCYQYV